MTSQPALVRLRAIAPPMIPSPTTPTTPSSERPYRSLLLARVYAGGFSRIESGNRQRLVRAVQELDRRKQQVACRRCSPRCARRTRPARSEDASSALCNASHRRCGRRDNSRAPCRRCALSRNSCSRGDGNCSACPAAMCRCQTRSLSVSDTSTLPTQPLNSFSSNSRCSASGQCGPRVGRRLAAARVRCSTFSMAVLHCRFAAVVTRPRRALPSGDGPSPPP